MYPDIFGIHNLSYIICLILGVVLAVVLAVVYLVKKGLNKANVIDLLICTCFAVAGGVIFAILFENLYEVIEKKDNYLWTWGMTFYGGLFGGAFGFLLTYFLMRKKISFNLGDVLKIAPVSIVLGHGIGRIGCFLAGCCYGKHTDSALGMEFPKLGKVLPVQLYEALFLLLLFVIMLVLLIKKNFKYNFVIYLSAYGIFRFLIEFLRDDPRGVSFALSPSQVWSLIFIVASVPMYFLLKRVYEEK